MVRRYTCEPDDDIPYAKCQTFGPQFSSFRPRDADVTIQNPGDAWFWEVRRCACAPFVWLSVDARAHAQKDHAFWNASMLWNNYLPSVGHGGNHIINVPPDSTGILVFLVSVSQAHTHTHMHTSHMCAQVEFRRNMWSL